MGDVERFPCGIFLYSMSLDYIVFATRNVESKTLEKYDTLLGEREKDMLLKMGNGLTGAMVGVPDGMPIGLGMALTVGITPTPWMRPELGGMETGIGSCWG